MLVVAANLPKAKTMSSCFGQQKKRKKERNTPLQSSDRMLQIRSVFLEPEAGDVPGSSGGAITELWSFVLEQCIRDKS